MRVNWMPWLRRTHLHKWRSVFWRYCSTWDQTLHSRGTIFALSTGHGKAGVAIIRVSGPAAAESLQKMVRSFPEPRKAVLQKIHYPSSTEAIDKGLVLWFPGPHSFTGEDCAEFQVHGGTAVVVAMLTALGRIQGFRHAEAGEFTKRAFMNGRLDLTEVEGLADLISAETEAQRRQALRQMDGELRSVFSRWRKTIIKCLANVEAYIDFSEDENIEDNVLDDVRQDISTMVEEMNLHLHDNLRGERLRSGVHVTIIGEPNVGKSSLLNILSQRPAAIVSPIAGTTRDVVETALSVSGYPVLLSDTAGLREAGDDVEREGIRRALERAKQADIRILLVDAMTYSSHKHNSLNSFLCQHLHKLGLDPTNDDDSAVCQLNNNNDSSICQSDIRSVDSMRAWGDTILVFNKCDLVPGWTLTDAEDKISTACISCTTRSGITQFVDLLAEKVKHACGNPLAGNPSLTQARHRGHLTVCVDLLNSFLRTTGEADIVIAAEQLRKASQQLAQISGSITAEDILDVIFKDFCIGK